MSQAARSLKINVAASWLVHGIGLVIGFFLMPYVIRTLGDSSYGVWVFINSFVGYAGLLYLGLGHTVSRYVAKHSAAKEWDELNQVASLVFFVYLAMGLLAFTIAAVLAWIVPYYAQWSSVSPWEFRLVILVLGLNVASGLAGSAFGGVLVGLRRYDLERGISLSIDILRTVLIFVFLSQTWGLLTISLIYLVVTLAENLGYIIMVYRELPQLSIRWKHINRRIFNQCVEFSGFSLLSNIAQQLIYATDIMVIGLLMEEAAVVPYFIASRLCTMLRMPLEKINEICIPTAGALDAHGDSGTLRGLLSRAVGASFLLSASALIGAYFYGNVLITTWIGTSYSSAYTVLLLLLVGQLIAMPVGVIRGLLFGMGNARVPALVYLAEAIANLLLSIWLIGPLGLVGVALGTIIPIIIFEMGMILPLGLRTLKLSFWRMTEEALLPQVIPLCLVWIYAYSVQLAFPVHNNWPALVSIAGGAVVVMAGGWWFQMRLARWAERKTIAEAA